MSSIFLAGRLDNWDIEDVVVYYCGERQTEAIPPPTANSSQAGVTPAVARQGSMAPSVRRQESMAQVAGKGSQSQDLVRVGSRMDMGQ